jgi:predicted nucleic acid-binding protein
MPKFLEERLIAVGNTGPIISIFQCRRIDLLQRYFSLIHIPSFELEEFKRHHALPIVKDLINSGLIIVHDLSKEEKIEAKKVAEAIALSPLTKIKDPKVHLGEGEAMVLMKREELKADVLLVDELAVRKIAEDMGFSIIGFLGILIKSYEEGILNLEEVRDLIRLCQQQGSRYSEELIESIFKELQDRRCES